MYPAKSVTSRFCCTDWPRCVCPSPSSICGLLLAESGDVLVVCLMKISLWSYLRFQMKDCNPVNTPFEFGVKLHKDIGGKKVDATLYKQIVGSLKYLTATRPDIMHVVSIISRYMDCASEMHLLAAKRIFRYLQGLNIPLGFIVCSQYWIVSFRSEAAYVRLATRFAAAKFPNINEARTGIQELLSAHAVGAIAENVKHIS
ncbi:hypothetical protein ZIOFF_036649 [Zingiber officinale]|uniref:Uncharacterized protein n=1 Tax=Zingiber officinale TaxID=94328 RepID=A0A8J5GAN1_ZINOF|nr:hypothetical protein ZIOFF_036649 [Zingiber officinale]